MHKYRLETMSLQSNFLLFVSLEYNQFHTIPKLTSSPDTQKSTQTTGFLPTTDCTASAIYTLDRGDFLACTTDPSCTSAQHASDLWGPLGQTLCPATNSSTRASYYLSSDVSSNCKSLPYGATDPARAGARVDDDTGPPGHFPSIFIYPILIVAFLVSAAMVALVLRRRHVRERRRASGMTVRRDSYDQGLPAYEEHWRSGRVNVTNEWPSYGMQRGEWGEAPPDYEPKRPEGAVVRGERMEEGGDTAQATQGRSVVRSAGSFEIFRGRVLV
ncbi:hypothetical protein BT63DRAFT_151313 [Microthyrium microscopicum]|uniref:Uncharacterized protein n=1 Tax=Microthyrium microscopicum TaxID=703497 RepID=A0A6A6UN93_9PEZI|nr:hypothetical protein BT63DRAFT_151313 [Microthyrium microscopicum]